MGASHSSEITPETTNSSFAFLQMVPVVASNRVGTEILLNEDGSQKQRITFYGRSFITDGTGAIVREAGEEQHQPYIILSTNINPEANKAARCAWGLFRDRRPELYSILQTKDGC
jgi:N-carbamoylputrescine amidase